MKKQTAVEWIYDKFMTTTPNDFVELFEQAKVIEEEQKIKNMSKVIEYMLKYPISEELRTELTIDFDKGVFVLSEYMSKIIKSLN